MRYADVMQVRYTRRPRLVARCMHFKVDDCGRDGGRLGGAVVRRSERVAGYLQDRILPPAASIFF
jgi:hypothetical protein